MARPNLSIILSCYVLKNFFSSFFKDFKEIVFLNLLGHFSAKLLFILNLSFMKIYFNAFNWLWTINIALINMKKETKAIIEYPN